MIEKKRATEATPSKQQHKDTENTHAKLTNRQQNVLNLLKKGHTSVIDVVFAFGYSDPRGYFKTLRTKGVDVKSEWIRKKDVRYKIYWV